LSDRERFARELLFQLFSFGLDIEALRQRFDVRQIEILGRDALTGGHDDGAFHPVFELAYISRPAVRRNRLQGRFGKARNLLVVEPVEAIQEVLRENRAVAVAFGRVLSEVGAALIVGGNIKGETRTLTTAITLATSQGDFGLAVALGLILLALALTVNAILQMLHGRGDA
jgi:hypothetical protein